MHFSLTPKHQSTPYSLPFVIPICASKRLHSACALLCRNEQPHRQHRRCATINTTSTLSRSTVLCSFKSHSSETECVSVPDWRLNPDWSSWDRASLHLCGDSAWRCDGGKRQTDTAARLCSTVPQLVKQFHTSYLIYIIMFSYLNETVRLYCW
jgi:hypothetical protein